MDLEDELAEFTRQVRVAHTPVTTEPLNVKALVLARNRGLSRRQFRVSWNWIARFMKRKGFLVYARSCRRLVRKK